MKLSVLALTALTSVSLAEPPATINISQLPQQAQLIDKVVVPVPSEIFAVLDKIDRPVWTEVQRPGAANVKPTGEQAQIALLLGTVIGEGFIAVEAEDTEAVKNIGRCVLTLAKAIGVEKSVLKRSNSIIAAAGRKDWVGVRKDLDRALSDVQGAMTELKSEQLSQLVSLGGWLRGTEALTAVVSRKYNPDGAELLHQPVLLDYFEKRLASMPPKIKANPVVTKVQQGILNIRPLIGTDNGSKISEKSVKEIGTIAEDLVKSINSKVP
ncbi:MAG TPA: hypothetical protein VF593_04365 [Chthoniobacteraceae bacterium]